MKMGCNQPFRGTCQRVCFSVPTTREQRPRDSASSGKIDHALERVLLPCLLKGGRWHIERHRSPCLPPGRQGGEDDAHQRRQQDCPDNCHWLVLDILSAAWIAKFSKVSLDTAVRFARYRPRLCRNICFPRPFAIAQSGQPKSLQFIHYLWYYIHIQLHNSKREFHEHRKTLGTFSMYLFGDNFGYRSGVSRLGRRLGYWICYWIGYCNGSQKCAKIRSARDGNDRGIWGRSVEQQL